MHYLYLPTIFAIGIVMHLALIRNARPLGLIDTPNERSMHKRITPRGAGIALFLSVALTNLFLNVDYVLAHPYLHGAVLLIFLVGVLDDRFDVSPRAKFVAIFLATLLLYQEGIAITTLGSAFGAELALPWLLVFPFTFFAIAGFTNALNLIDGLDGLAGSVSLIILGTFLVIGILYDDALMITLSASFIVALGAFLVFNWNPAVVFMGDSGSLTLGFVIAVLSIQSIHYITPTSVLFIIALPLLDTFIVMTRRIQRGMSPFQADKNHLHHFLYNVKGDVKFTVTLLASIQLAFSIIGAQLREANDLLSLVLFAVLFYIFLNLFDQRMRYRRKRRSRYRRPTLRTRLHSLAQKEREDAPEEKEKSFPKRTLLFGLRGKIS